MATKTDLFKSLRKFLDLTTAKDDLKEGGHADVITIHLISMCGKSDIVCHTLSQNDFTTYVLKMLQEYPAVMSNYDEKKHVRKVSFSYFKKCHYKNWKTSFCYNFKITSIDVFIMLKIEETTLHDNFEKTWL